MISRKSLKADIRYISDVKPSTRRDGLDLSRAFGWLRTLSQRIQQDDCPGLAAEMAYSLILSLVPGMIFLVSLVALIGRENNTLPMVLSWIREFAPADAAAILQQTMEAAYQGSSGGLTFVSFVGALWSASNGAKALIKGLVRSYYPAEPPTKPFWYQPVMAVSVVLALGITMFIGSNLVVFGDSLLQLAGAFLHLSLHTIFWVQVLRWGIVVLVLTTFVGGLYYFMARTQGVPYSFRNALKGGLVFVLLWVAISLGFSFYVNHFSHYNPVYGGLWGVAILLTWLYLSSLALLIGGETSALLNNQG